MTQQRIDRATLQGVELEYEVQGAGEPVVLIHPGHFADWFRLCWMSRPSPIITAYSPTIAPAARAAALSRVRSVSRNRPPTVGR